MDNTNRLILFLPSCNFPPPIMDPVALLHLNRFLAIAM